MGTRLENDHDDDDDAISVNEDITVSHVAVTTHPRVPSRIARLLDPVQHLAPVTRYWHRYRPRDPQRHHTA
jgi:hypothetical protein